MPPCAYVVVKAGIQWRDAHILVHGELFFKKLLQVYIIVLHLQHISLTGS